MAKKNAVAPLIIESHPTTYTGYPFITLIEYRSQHLLTIIDSVTDKEINAFVLDVCGPESVSEELIITVAVDWFSETEGTRFPLSFEFAKRGLAEASSKIYRTYPKDFITRVIGPVPPFDMGSTGKTKRRKRRPIPAGMLVTGGWS